MQGHGEDDVKNAPLKKPLTVPCHQPPERFPQRELTPVFEMLEHFAKWVAAKFIGGITGPSARSLEVGRAHETSAAQMVVSAAVEIGSTAVGAQRMGNQPDLSATGGAETAVAEIEKLHLTIATPGRINPV
jgi:hypothetical protein